MPPNTVDQPVTKLNHAEARRKRVESDGDLCVWGPFTQVELTRVIEVRKWCNNFCHIHNCARSPGPRKQFPTRRSCRASSQSGQVPVVAAEIQFYPGMFEKIRNMAWKRALLANEKMIPEVAAEITMTLIAY